ncbi:hypothetical protein CGK17_23020 [Vibrio parahaemolyticus]|uniref:MarR family transcriptional regulator n=1 Tax=Vibrio parahaemolyticus TaxID=670 RepID=UPI0011235EC3|nr:helix-turn-helix domain-containing protein [Vibrio parahaemolyticus]TOA86337.1 hypothetical protein CGK17_23020 [Vibrio parahaemolyticus]
MKVSNPLTIIAIFAGVAEAMAAVALVNLPLEIQHIFVYFVIAFPVLIVILFFTVLIFKNTALYAPSDFEDQVHYLEIHNLNEKVGMTLDEVLTDVSKRGGELTRSDLDNAKSAVAKTITLETMPSQTLAVLEQMGVNPTSAVALGSKLGLSKASTKTYLVYLEKHGFVERTENQMWKRRT